MNRHRVPIQWEFTRQTARKNIWLHNHAVMVLGQPAATTTATRPRWISGGSPVIVNRGAVYKMNQSQVARMAKLADARDLKSRVPNRTYRFDSGSGHHVYIGLRVAACESWAALSASILDHFWLSSTFWAASTARPVSARALARCPPYKAVPDS